MTTRRRWLPILGALALLAAPAPLRADDLPPPDPIRRAAARAAQAGAAAAAPAPARGSRVKRNAVRGALIGAGAAAVVVVAAAAAYGANEGGGICGACALQWGAIGIGAGAGIGAGIGALIGAAAPSHQPGVWPAGTTPAPLPRRGLGVALRF